MLLSIVIVTYNRSSFLQDTLLKLSAQTDKEFEVIIASDGATDNTQIVVNALSSELPYSIKFVDTYCPEYGLAVARNLGIIHASGDLVVILDDDSVPTDDFVAAHKAGAKPNTITGGPRIPNNPDDVRMAWKAKALSAVDDLVPLSIDEHRKKWPDAYLIENNICMFRDDIIRLGMFNERVKLYGFIGQEFFARAAHFDINFQVNRAAKIYHHGEIEGDNGLLRSKKKRQVFRSSLLLPALCTAKHFSAQADWAHAYAQTQQTPVNFKYPSFSAAYIAKLPPVIAGKALTTVKQQVKRLLKAAGS